MDDRAALILLVVLFAALSTVHVTIVVGLASRAPRWRALVALGVLPLAPWWAMREGMRARAALWIVLFAGYVLARVLFGG